MGDATGRERDGPRPLVIDVRSARGETSLRLAGVVDVSGEIDLRAEAQALRDYKPTRVTLDLRDVSAIDVRGAASLSALIRSAHASGAEVTVMAPPGVRDALEKLGSDAPPA